MPCDSIRYVEMTIKNCDRELFKQAAAALGHRYTESGTCLLLFDKTNTFIGELNGDTLTIDADTVRGDYKREYSIAVVLKQNKARGWKSVRKGNQVLATK